MAGLVDAECRQWALACRTRCFRRPDSTAPFLLCRKSHNQSAELSEVSSILTSIIQYSRRLFLALGWPPQITLRAVSPPWRRRYLEAASNDAGEDFRPNFPWTFTPGFAPNLGRDRQGVAGLRPSAHIVPWSRPVYSSAWRVLLEEYF